MNFLKKRDPEDGPGGQTEPESKMKGSTKKDKRKGHEEEISAYFESRPQKSKTHERMKKHAGRQRRTTPSEQTPLGTTGVRTESTRPLMHPRIPETMRRPSTGVGSDVLPSSTRSRISWSESAPAGRSLPVHDSAHHPQNKRPEENAPNAGQVPKPEHVNHARDSHRRQHDKSRERHKAVHLDSRMLIEVPSQAAVQMEDERPEGIYKSAQLRSPVTRIDNLETEPSRRATPTALESNGPENAPRGQTHPVKAAVQHELPKEKSSSSPIAVLLRGCGAAMTREHHSAHMSLQRLSQERNTRIRQDVEHLAEFSNAGGRLYGHHADPTGVHRDLVIDNGTDRTWIGHQIHDALGLHPPGKQSNLFTGDCFYEHSEVEYEEAPDFEEYERPDEEPLEWTMDDGLVESQQYDDDGAYEEVYGRGPDTMLDDEKGGNHTVFAGFWRPNKLY